jgi:hypothetical protein
MSASHECAPSLLLDRAGHSQTPIQHPLCLHTAADTTSSGRAEQHLQRLLPAFMTVPQLGVPSPSFNFHRPTWVSALTALLTLP